MRRPRRPAQDLRFSIECLPHHTRVAMLDGIESSSIIVGAYTDRDGGVCPMLAAHRRGGRTSLVSFARAWDRYTRAGRRSRRATDREVHTLSSMLKASLVRDESVRGEFAEAVAELEALEARRARGAEEAAARSGDAGAEAPVASEPGPPAEATPKAPAETGGRDRSEELGRRPGWAWLRVFRRLDEYEAALERMERAEREAERRQVAERELERV